MMKLHAMFQSPTSNLYIVVRENWKSEYCVHYIDPVVATLSIVEEDDYVRGLLSAEGWEGSYKKTLREAMVEFNARVTKMLH